MIFIGQKHDGTAVAEFHSPCGHIHVWKFSPSCPLAAMRAIANQAMAGEHGLDWLAAANVNKAIRMVFQTRKDNGQ